MPRVWPDHADEVIGGDQVVALAYATPAKGVVITPMTNFGIRDREAGALAAVNTSVGTARKLERIRRNPRIALAYHTRAHGFSHRPEYVLVQGSASLTPPSPDYPHLIQEAWERFAGSPDYGRLWTWWLREWLRRVAIELAVERVVVWPDAGCAGEPEVHGRPLPPDPPAPHRPPRNGTAPRVNHERAARRARRLPNVLLGWVGADGFPLIAPVAVAGAEQGGIVLTGPPSLVPPGGRRAGLTAHWCARHTVGQRLAKHTGWLEPDAGARLVYAPHTQTAYRLPTSQILFKLAAGGMTRREVARRRREDGRRSGDR